MQNKTAIWLFTILLTAASIYQLSFTWITNSVENDAESYASEKLDSLLDVKPEMSNYAQDSAFTTIESNYLLDVGSKEAYPLLGYTYRECKLRELNKGLDLQGGMNVTLEVSVVELVKVMAAESKDETFLKSINDAVELQKNSQEDFTSLFGQAVEANDPEFKLSSIFHNRENKDLFPREATNDEVLNIIKSEAEDAVKRTEQVLRKRIDGLGVVQPKIQRLATSDRIIVELPGVSDKKRVRKILQGTAKLEFWETYDNREVFQGFEKANEYMRELNKAGSSSQDSSVTEDNVNESLSELELGDAAIDSTIIDSTTSTDTEDLLSSLEGESNDTSAAARDQSFNEFAAENPLYSIVQMNVYQGTESEGLTVGEGPVVGYVSLKNKAEVDVLLADRNILKNFPSDIKFMWSAKPILGDDRKPTDVYALHAIKVLRRDGKARLEGDAISNATVTADPLGQPEISMSMNATGAKMWKQMTREASQGNVNGTPANKSIAVVLDNLVYSAPVVNGEIPGGQSSISGQFSPEEAQDLANVLKAGKLPVPAQIIEEAIVGPSLGQEAIQSGMLSFLVAFILVLLYMAFFYSSAGLIADIALIANVFFVFGVLTSIGATLTLPGIAGIVLTIGMSVDANVLLYERIREELRSGKGLKLAISEAFSIRGAIPSIMDANITTGLTGLILLVFGTGPIKGFATTLIIGIATSLFCAIFITRLIFEWQLRRKETLSFSTRWTENAFRNMNVKFIMRRKSYYVLSSIVVLAGIASLAIRGLDSGVDFTGGRSYLVRFVNPVEVENVGSTLETVFVSKDGIKQRPEVKTYGTSNQVKITTKYLIEEKGSEIEDLVEAKLKTGLNTIGDDFEIMSSQLVEPTIADDIKQSAIWSVLFSLVVIFLYILFRFRRWQYGLGALAAMFHDVLVVLGVFSLFYGIAPWSMEIDQAFIAAILTVVGYSINDTVVVFDRIREFLGLHKKMPYKTVVNNALNSTLSRTINTSMSTILVLLMIFIFGGEVIRGFVFALMVGVIVGTYSSLCIASPIVVDLANKDDRDKT